MPKPMKSPADIKAKMRDLLHRAQQNYIEQHRTECPENCRHALILGSKVQQCPKCAAHPGEPCRVKICFEQRFTYDQLREKFRELAGNREWIIRNLRDVAMLLWVIGDLGGQEPDPSPLPDYLQHDPNGPILNPQAPVEWMHLEGNTLLMSDKFVTVFAGMMERLRERQPPE